MTFPISIRTGSRTYHMTVELWNTGKGFETFKIYPVNDPHNFILLKGNRPLVRAKGLDKFPITWKVIQGEIKYQKNLEETIKKIEQVLEPKPKKKSVYLGPSSPQPDRKKDRGGSGWTMGNGTNIVP